MRAVLLPDAQEDLRELRRYISRVFGQATWQSSYDAVKESIRSAVAFPDTGSIPDELVELGLTQYRQTLFGMNRIVYEVNAGTLYIHIICDTRKDLRTLLARRLLNR